MTATVHELHPAERRPSLKPLITLVTPGLNAVNRVILDRMQSPVALIPELAGHHIAGDVKNQILSHIPDVIDVLIHVEPAGEVQPDEKC